MTTIPCVSLWQPWASLWAHGPKRIETRFWPFRGTMPCVLAVHAAKRWNEDLARLAREPYFREALDLIAPDAIWNARVCPLPTGAVVGLVRVKECVPTRIVLCDGVDAPPIQMDGGRGLLIGAAEAAFGDYTPGRHGWVTDAFRPLTEPIKERGYQGIWQWEAPVEVLEAAAELMRT